MWKRISARLDHAVQLGSLYSLSKVVILYLDVWVSLETPATVRQSDPAATRRKHHRSATPKHCDTLRCSTGLLNVALICTVSALRSRASHHGAFGKLYGKIFYIFTLLSIA